MVNDVSGTKKAVPLGTAKQIRDYIYYPLLSVPNTTINAYIIPGT